MSGLSVAEIERLLAEKRSRLEELRKRREELVQDLRLVESNIRDLGGEIDVPAPRKRTRFRNKQRLHDVVIQVLKKHGKGLTLADLEQAVRETGYRSTSERFTNVIYQCLYNASDQVVRDPKTLKYSLKSKRGAAPDGS